MQIATSHLTIERIEMTQPNSRLRTARHAADEGSTAVEADTEQVAGQHVAQEAMIGTDRKSVSDGNISWGAIFAGTALFLGIAILLGLIASAMGLQGAGIGAGIATLIGFAVAFAVAGYVSGALGVRAGLFHGLITWAVSILSTLILAGWLGASLIGGVGSVIGSTANSIAQTAGQAVSVNSDDARDASKAAEQKMSKEDVDNAMNQARDMARETAENANDTFYEVAPKAAEGTWWTVAGLILGAVISAFAGAAGSRSVLNKSRSKKVIVR